MVGSGAWACAAMHIVAQNCAADDEADEFVDDVRMWVFEEDCEVRLLGDLDCGVRVWGSGPTAILHKAGRGDANPLTQSQPVVCTAPLRL